MVVRKPHTGTDKWSSEALSRAEAHSIQVLNSRNILSQSVSQQSFSELVHVCQSFVISSSIR